MSDSYYHRVIKPRRGAGLCKFVKCDGKLYADGFCRRCYAIHRPDSTSWEERRVTNSWLTADWSKSDAELAREFAVKPSGAAAARFRFGPRCECCDRPMTHRVAARVRVKKQLSPASHV